MSRSQRVFGEVSCKPVSAHHNFILHPIQDHQQSTSIESKPLEVGERSSKFQVNEISPSRPYSPLPVPGSGFIGILSGFDKPKQPLKYHFHSNRRIVSPKGNSFPSISSDLYTANIPTFAHSPSVCTYRSTRTKSRPLPQVSKQLTHSIGCRLRASREA